MHSARPTVFTLGGPGQLQPRGSILTLPLNPAFEYGILPLEGRVVIDGETLDPDVFAYLGMHRQNVPLDFAPGSRALPLRGEPFGKSIVMWWNFVGFSRQAVAQAQREWKVMPPGLEPSRTENTGACLRCRGPGGLSAGMEVGHVLVGASTLGRL